MSETTTAAAPAPTPAPAPTAPDATTPATATVEPKVDLLSAAAPQPGATPTAAATTTTAATNAAASPAPTAEPTLAPTATTKTEETTVEEPENALTRKFTDAEKKALKSFRSELPAILEEAYTDKPELKSTSTLWGVPLSADTAKTDARVSVVLMKFLRARDLNVEKAKAMLTETLKWRDVTFKLADVLKEEFPQDVFGKVAHVAGTDKEGRPVVYNLYGANQDINAVFGDVERFLRWRVGVQERTALKLDFETIDQCVQIHDYANVPKRTPESKRAASEATKLFGDHYPELLHRKLFVSVPILMTWLFWAFKPVLPAATFAKMSVVGAGKETIKQALLPLVDESQIPTHYGGGLDAGF